MTTKRKTPESRCAGCPREVFKNEGLEVRPEIPTDARLLVVGSWERSRVAVRDALSAAGVDLATVGYLNIVRCLTSGFVRGEDENWKQAVKKCSAWLEDDLAGAPAAVVLALGPQAFDAVSGGLRFAAYRGTWIQSEGRDVFAARHPGDILELIDPAVKAGGLEEFRADVMRMADRLLDRQADDGVTVEVYETPAEAEPFLMQLAEHPGPWAFDIETYDAAQFPSRKEVSVDPFHPDFRIRGVAIATGPKIGAWVDFRALLHGPWDALSAAFGSPAEKWAFAGHFDAAGLVYSGWVPAVRNRAGDGMLAMVAMGDGTHDSLRLEKAVVDVLGMPQYWNGLDKSRMRDLSTKVVAAGAVRDACYTYRLCDDLLAKMTNGEHLTWRKLS